MVCNPENQPFLRYMHKYYFTIYFSNLKLSKGSFCQFALIYSTCILLILILTERLSFFDAFRGIIFFSQYNFAPIFKGLNLRNFAQFNFRAVRIFAHLQVREKLYCANSNTLKVYYILENLQIIPKMLLILCLNFIFMDL